MADTKQKSGSNQIVKLALVLFAVAAIMALVLALMNEVTKDTIAERARVKTETAYHNVLEAASYEELDPASYENDDSMTITRLSEGRDASGATVGYVAETTFSGAQGMVTMVVGLDDELTCTGIYVTEHSETSGLGAKAADTSAGAWRDNLVGQGDGLGLTKNGGSVQAISGATITSNAVVNEVQTVIDAVKSLG